MPASHCTHLVRKRGEVLRLKPSDSQVYRMRLSEDQAQSLAPQPGDDAGLPHYETLMLQWVRCIAESL
jgi:hypothetical protein